MRRILSAILLAISLLASASAAEVLVPVVPMPHKVETGETPVASGYSSFRLRSSYPKSDLEAVWGEISELSTTGGRTLKVVIKAIRSDRRDFYTMVRRSDRVTICASSSDAAFYSLQTLKQLIRGGFDRDFRIEDWPDIPERVFADDISRGEVPTIEQIKRQIRLASEWKYSGVTFYIENVVTPLSHPDFAPADGRLTMEDLDEITAYARRYHLDLVGSFQSFGHFEKILALPQYRPLGATEGMIDTNNPQARSFLSDVIAELCRHSDSPWFSALCDETFDIKDPAVYASHITFLRDLAASNGKQLMICGDMILKYPEILAGIPEDVIILTWNYDAAKTYEPWISMFRESGREFWVSPGVHSSNRILPDMDAAEGNRLFVKEGFDSGAKGCMVFTWDESTFHSVKHLYYGLAQFAETMWNTCNVALTDEFRERYELSRFGARCGLAQLFDDTMALKEFSIFSGMNDRVFYQRFTPTPSEPLSLDFAQLDEACRLVRSFRSRIDAAAPLVKRNSDEVEAWRYAIDCYLWMCEARLAMKRLDPYELSDLEKEAVRLQSEFVRIWDSENQPYMRSAGIASYEAKIAELRSLRSLLGSGAPLVVNDRQNAYMCFWLTTLSNDESVDGNGFPTPGKRFTDSLGDNKWTKTESLNGLSMDYNAFYSNPMPGRYVHSYALVNSDRVQPMTLRLGFVGRAEVSLNGETVFASTISNSLTPDQFEIPVTLSEGVNHLFIKLEKSFPEFGFTAILEGAQINSRKHKYTLINEVH